jgi:hypothetical protein
MVLIFGAQEAVRAFAVLQVISKGTRPTFKDMLHIRFVGEGVRALTLTGPFLAEPARAWFIKRQGVHSHEAAAATITDFFVHSCVSAMAATAAALYFLDQFPSAGPIRIAVRIFLYASAGYLLLAAIVLYRRVRFVAPLAGALSRLPLLRHRWSGAPETFLRTEDSILAVLRDQPSTLAKLLLLQVVSHALLLLEVYWALLSMGVTVSAVTAFLSEVLTKLANVVLIAGAAEGAYAIVFSALGLPAAAGFTLSLLKRARSLAVALIGIGSLALLTTRRPRLTNS